MKSCFLCLKVTKDEVGCISIKSKQWQELNITNIIEKHLWPMVSFRKSLIFSFHILIYYIFRKTWKLYHGFVMLVGK